MRSIVLCWRHCHAGAEPIRCQCDLQVFMTSRRRSWEMPAEDHQQKSSMAIIAGLGGIEFANGTLTSSPRPSVNAPRIHCRHKRLFCIRPYGLVSQARPNPQQRRPDRVASSLAVGVLLSESGVVRRLPETRTTQERAAVLGLDRSFTSRPFLNAPASWCGGGKWGETALVFRFSTPPSFKFCS